jgi:L-asparaginase
MMKDSLHIDAHDRQLILEACQRAPEERIMITHGTDTMAETARYLYKNIDNKTIILTGAMIPYSFGSSDGLFNFGSALSFVQILSTGVWVAMNGELFPGDQVEKDRSSGIFLEKQQ